MEMVADWSGDGLWKWEGTAQATAYGNGRGLLGNRLWKRERAV